MVVASKLAAIAPSDKNRTLADRAMATIHEAIITGVLAPGERLPIEELASILNMSPMPVREALRLLASVGLVENVPHRGARVTELTLTDLREVYEARLGLEPLAVRRAAENFTPDDADQAKRRLYAHVEAYGRDDVRLIWSTHTAFHFSLYEASRSRWIVRLIQPLWETSERYRFAMLPIRKNLEQRRFEHERILEACIAHEPDIAARELHNHLVVTANLIANQMGSEDLFELEDATTSSTVAWTRT